MRVALVHFLAGDAKAEEAVIENLRAASTKIGNEVTVLSGLAGAEQNALSFYDYIAVLIRPDGMLSAKVPENVRRYFISMGTFTGKKGCALVMKQGLRSAKTCRNLMALLEKQGLRLDYFDSIRDAVHAESVGRNIG